MNHIDREIIAERPEPDMNPTPVNDLAGRRVLVVEDETLVSMLLQDMLEDLGCEVLGPLTRVDEALEFLAEGDPIDVAILDVNLAGERSFSVAQALHARGAPFALSTGYDEGSIDEAWRDRPILRKPFLAGHLETALRQALGLPPAA
jgi:CheY-like chemotaxis protein